MTLTVVIPTIPERFSKFNLLFNKVVGQAMVCKQQHPSLGEVEILYDDDVKFINGGKTVGKKRNDLIQKANGKYVCFLDDDDNIAPNYIETILRLCLYDADIITFRSLFKCDTYWSVIDMSMHHKVNNEATPQHVVKRKPWHICPVRTEIAKEFSFPDINNAEDWGWMEQVLTMVKTESKTNAILHQYNHSAAESAVDEIERL